MSKASLPLLVASITNEALSVLAVGPMLAVYFFQSFDEVESLLSARMSPLGVCRLTIKSIGVSVS